jgi:hypothetical protein
MVGYLLHSISSKNLKTIISNSLTNEPLIGVCTGLEVYQQDDFEQFMGGHQV